jgi:hypothetical protein
MSERAEAAALLAELLTAAMTADPCEFYGMKGSENCEGCPVRFKDCMLAMLADMAKEVADGD